MPAVVRSAIIMTLTVVLGTGCATVGRKAGSGIDSPLARVEIAALNHEWTQWSGSNGSGFFVTSDGYLVTCEHVVHPTIKGQKLKPSFVKVRIDVGSSAERTRSAKIVAYDEKSDLALLKVSRSSGRVPLRLAKPGTVAPGDRVRTQGFPSKGGFRETKGSVLAVVAPDRERTAGLLLCSAQVRRGQSGGPVIDSRGLVVGVTTAISEVDATKLTDLKTAEDATIAKLEGASVALDIAKLQTRLAGSSPARAAELESMAVDARQAMASHARHSAIIKEALKHPNKTHAIDVATLRRFLAAQGLRIGE